MNIFVNIARFEFLEDVGFLRIPLYIRPGPDFDIQIQNNRQTRPMHDEKRC